MKPRLLQAFASMVVALALPLPAGAQDRHAVEGKVRSFTSDATAELTFVNQSGATVKMYWLDYQGNRKFYYTLPDGKSYVQRTFLTHPWLVTDEKDNAWYVYFPEGQPRTIPIAAPR